MSTVANNPISILFIRDFGEFSGGHLKVFDYMHHVMSSRWAEASLYFTSGSSVAAAAPLIPKETRLVGKIFRPDALFLAGLDWESLGNAEFDVDEVPVINLVQSVRHAALGDPRRRYLRRPALRICVSKQVARAILETGEVNGPVHAIPNAIDLSYVAELITDRKADRIFIGGLKNNAMATEIARNLAAQGFAVDLCNNLIPRAQFLRRMGECAVCVLLPYPFEGFFLPALEAMALGTAVVVPDCIGARDFCVDCVTALVPEYTVADICAAVGALSADNDLRARLIREGIRIAKLHDLGRERETFLALLRDFLETAVALRQ